MFYWALAHCGQLHYVVPNEAHPLLDPYYALENVGYSMLTNFDAGVPYDKEFHI